MLVLWGVLLAVTTTLAIIISLCATVGFWATLNTLVWVLCLSGGVLLLAIIAILVCTYVMGRRRTSKLLKSWGHVDSQITVAFFHPYCASGGGGERVLWNSIQALQNRYSFVRCVIYSADSAKDGEKLLKDVKGTFDISLGSNVELVRLRATSWLQPKMWPLTTLLGQSLGSMVVGLEALGSFIPNVYVDTTGHAFNTILFKWIGRCKTSCYIHYPTISTDMLRVVKNKEEAFNNAAWISRSPVITWLKLVYYKLFCRLYSLVGNRSDVVMVNSSWTHGHIKSLWNPRRLSIVYPPCDTQAFLSASGKKDQFKIVSIGQFRPEKNHKMQLEILQKLLGKVREPKNIKLVFIGSCRNAEDRSRLEELKQYAKKLKISNNTVWRVGIQFNEMKQELGRGTAALHVMRNEHFGIGVVECMAAGCIMVAHDSGGPQMDIVKEWRNCITGFLADSVDMYVDNLLSIYGMSEEQREAIASAARASVDHRFSVARFQTDFLRATEVLFNV